MKTYPIVMMALMLVLAGIACNPGTPAGAAVQLTEVAQEALPTTTKIADAVETKEITPTPAKITVVTAIPSNNNSSNNTQATAVLPAKMYPLLDSTLSPSPEQCIVVPAQAGTLVNVRRGADLGYETFLQLKTWATVFADVNGWYAIDLEGPNPGYVSSSVTKLQGNCAKLYPTPIPTRDMNRCYFDIPMMAGIEVDYFNEPTASGNQRQGKMVTLNVLITAKKSGWYQVANMEGKTGWLPMQMGTTVGNCSPVPDKSPATPICLIVAYYDGNAYHTPFTGKDVFGTVSAGESRAALARTVDGWYGFDPGIAQAGNEGLDRLRWVYPNQTNVFRLIGDCNSVPTAYDKSSDWDIVIEPAGEPPAVGCSVLAQRNPFTIYIYDGVANPEVIGVLNTYASFVSLGDLGYVIQIAEGKTGWVSQGAVALVGDACPV